MYKLDQLQDNVFLKQDKTKQQQKPFSLSATHGENTCFSVTFSYMIQFT